MITARPGSNATSIPILTEVLELPTQLATPLPVVPQELVPQHLAPVPMEPPPPEPLVMRTRGAGGEAEFSARLVGAAGLSEHAVPEPQPVEAVAPPAIDLDALAERLRADILADLQEHIEPALRARMIKRLEPVLRMALADISRGLQDEIGSLVDEAVQKALIRHVTTQD